MEKKTTRAPSGVKRGRKPKAVADKRQHHVACRLTDDELALVDARRGGMSRGAWLRTAALQRPPAVIPEINRRSWTIIGNIAKGVRYLIDQVKAGEPTPADMLNWLEQLAADLPRIRARLLTGDGK
jgi:hypothetical protein